MHPVVWSDRLTPRAAARATAGLLAWVAIVAAQSPSTAGHPGEYARADIEYGARLYAEHCERCHGANGAGVAGVDLRSGKFRHATSDRQLANVITEGFPTAGMPPMNLDPADLAGVIAYVRNMNAVDPGSLKLGDAGRGRLVFEGKGACLSCHRVNGKGSRKAPELSDVGALRSAGSLERSLLDPTSQMMPINRPVRIVTRDGKVIEGRRLNEDTYTVQIADEEGRLISLAKDGLREFTISTKSPMPSYRDKLSSEELADVVSYLLSLKGL
jgi:putative heme-binding domain-containing protein